MVVVLFVVVAVVVSGPVVAAGLVSVASRREDSAWTLGGPPTGLVQTAARRIVGFHAHGIEWPRPQAHDMARTRECTPAWEDLRSPTDAAPPRPPSAADRR
jgi:hypothetical protein